MNETEKETLTVVQQYSEEFPALIETLINDTRAKLDAEADPRDFLAELCDELHRLGGAAHCMGFRKIGLAFDDVLATADRLLQDSTYATPNDLDALHKRISAIRSFQPFVRVENSRIYKMFRTDQTIGLDDETRAQNDVREEALRSMMSRERILFADDDVYIRKIAETALNSLGTGEVRCASSGADVLLAINEFEPTLIITDWQMEPVNGLELLQSIRGGRSLIEFDTPVVFFTSNSDREQIRTALRLGATKVLIKPIVPSQLAEEVLKISEKRFRIRRRLEKAA